MQPQLAKSHNKSNNFRLPEVLVNRLWSLLSGFQNVDFKSCICPLV